MPEIERPHQHDDGTALQCPLPEFAGRSDSLSSDVSGVLLETGCPLGSMINERLKFEAVLSELSAKFVNLPAEQVDSQIAWGLQQVVELLGLDRSGLGEVSPDGKQFVVTHSYQLKGIPPSAGLNLGAHFPTYARMIRQGRVIRLPDDFPGETEPEREYCRAVGLKANLTVPLTVMGTVVGGIGFSSFRTRRVLPDALVPRLRLLGDIFTNALARKGADESLRAKEQTLRMAKERLQQLAGQLMDAQEQERRRVAREMHDDWSQRLAVLGMDLAKLEGELQSPRRAESILQALQEQLTSLSADIHALSHQLHPSILEDLGLVEAIRSECDSVSTREGHAIDFQHDQVPPVLSKPVALCIYRVAQEGLRNVVKHAGVNEATVNLSADGSELRLEVQDHGAGFDPENGSEPHGLGLSSMAERVLLVGGRFSVSSTPGRGTTIEVCVPLGEGDL